MFAVFIPPITMTLQLMSFGSNSAWPAYGVHTTDNKTSDTCTLNSIPYSDKIKAITVWYFLCLLFKLLGGVIHWQVNIGKPAVTFTIFWYIARNNRRSSFRFKNRTRMFTLQVNYHLSLRIFFVWTRLPLLWYYIYI